VTDTILQDFINRIHWYLFSWSWTYFL